MKVTRVRVGTQTEAQLRWLASQHWGASCSVRQGLRLGTTLGILPSCEDRYPFTRNLWLSPSDLEALRATGLPQSVAIRAAIAVAYRFHQQLQQGLREVA